MTNFKILSIFFKIPGPQYSYQKCRQMCSRMKFASPNSRFLPFLVGICMGGTLRMSNFQILSIFFRFLDPNIVTNDAIKCVLG
jgi:hypothetical protein